MPVRPQVWGKAMRRGQEICHEDKAGRKRFIRIAVVDESDSV